jgi:hypothetical protein
MRGPDTDNQKDTHVSVRLDAETVDYLDGLGRELGYVRGDGSGVNRSQTLRTIIKTHHGVLFGNFFGVVEPGKLSDEWGDVGHLLAAAAESERGVPESVKRARLADVLAPLPVLTTAAEVELEGGLENGD